MKKPWVLLVFLLLWLCMCNNITHAGVNQITDTLVMVSPDYFQYNIQTAITNGFQHHIDNKDAAITKQAVAEFSEMVSTLRAKNIRVITLASRPDAVTPDAVFPNNWFSIHRLDGNLVLVLYPMLAENRRLELQPKTLINALKASNIQINKIIDLSYYINENKSLEGTGSLVLDRQHKIAYASLSLRTNSDILKKFSKELGYRIIAFSSYDTKNELIYHTNVMMSIGSQFSVVCGECIKNIDQRNKVIASLKKSNKKIILITQKQTASMSGNILQVVSIDKKTTYIVLSQNAYQAFSASQRQLLETFGQLVIVSIPTIEKIGGGSARCMLAEVFP